ncbi:MAG: DMT family transporter [Corallococcus sp.]|nr:DMT family transporter [Corallococcus sp.]MCM1359361.1 DMT family transporter [Corallococcus sp.]MCM1394804.1 DMT family transporter [Corallococcus sp.]
MGNSEKRQHNIALVMLCVTAAVWGAGFVFGNSLLDNGFKPIPLSLNAIRFLFGAIVLIAIFARKIKLTKQLLLYGTIGGAMLAIAFSLQLVGLKYTTPAACGFFTAAYGIFVPFMAWLVYKKRPSWLMFLGVGVALCGLVILNVNSMGLMQSKDVLLGNMLTLLGSMFFAMQIVFADYCLHKKKIDSTGLTVVQVAACAIFMTLAALFEIGNYRNVNMNWNECWWRLCIVAIMGTAFAYFAQTFAQTRLSPTETSIILACECPVGAVISVALGEDALSWQICVGGILVIASVILIEVLPNVLERKKSKIAVNETTTEEIIAENNAPNDEIEKPVDTSAQEENDKRLDDADDTD